MNTFMKACGSIVIVILSVGITVKMITTESTKTETLFEIRESCFEDFAELYAECCNTTMGDSGKCTSSNTGLQEFCEEQSKIHYNECISIEMEQ